MTIWDVFLSYNRREYDAGNNFLQHLHDALNQNGMKSYKYRKDLDGSEDPTVDEAIKSSRIAVVVLSRHYPSSELCLRELVKILEQNKRKGMVVIPLFIEVEPSWVRRQRESYHEAMEVHENRYGSSSDEARRWREALKEVADLRGWALAENQAEADFIQGVVRRIGKKVKYLKEKLARAIWKYLKWAALFGFATAGALLLSFSPSIALLMLAGFSSEMIGFLSFNAFQAAMSAGLMNVFVSKNLA